MKSFRCKCLLVKKKRINPGVIKGFWCKKVYGVRVRWCKGSLVQSASSLSKSSAVRMDWCEKFVVQHFEKLF